MLSRRFRFSAMGCVLLGALASTTPAHALPTIPLAAAAAPATFTLSLDGHELGVFAELISLSSSVDPGTKGGKKFTVVLRRQANRNIEFAAWLELVALGSAGYKKSVTLNGRVGGTDTMRFHMTNAFPSKVEITAEGKSGVLMETVTMTCEMIQRVAI